MRRHKRRSNENSPAWQDNLSSFSRERERGPMRPLEVSPPPVGAQLQAAKSTSDAVYSVDRREGGTVMVHSRVLLIHTDTAGDTKLFAAGSYDD